MSLLLGVELFVRTSASYENSSIVHSLDFDVLYHLIPVNPDFSQ